ncbi:MAG TPA: peptidoglycan-binding protein [Myxococcota bacterium]|nr:peptidoglycan-binding protein [Myxococcota bacterium]
MAQAHERASSGEKPVALKKGGSDAAVGGPERQPGGNAAANERVTTKKEDSTAKGPTKKPWLDGALAMAFGRPVDLLEAAFGKEGENNALNAKATTRGKKMSFGSGMDLDPKDTESMEILGHEVAHALAGGGSGQTPVDMPGDQGEQAADTAGERFAQWAAQDFTGAAPKLQPAAGGKAAVHRYAKSPSVLTGTPQLKQGSRGDLVKTLQYCLNKLGENLDVDGSFGRRTEAAVKRFQASHALGIDGVVGPRTASSINSALGGSQNNGSSGGNSGGSSGGASGQLDGKPELKKGSRGALVKTLQSYLNKYGASVVVDGDFGSGTQAAVMAFQQANGLSVDGVVGPRTASTLTSGNAKKISSGGGGSSGGSKEEPKSVSEWRDRLLSAASKHLGALYWWGADGPTYFDCSGFVLYVMRQDTGLISWGDDTAGGICSRLPKTNDPQKGDLVFFWSGGSVEHVEMVTGSGSGTIGAGGGGSRTRGDNPNAKVKWDTWTTDSRPHTFGSVRSLIDGKLAKK